MHELFDHLWTDYAALNPRAQRIYDLLLARERAIDPAVTRLVNDHVALRTFDLPGIGEADLAAPFLRLGYQPRGEYVFKVKKLFARHYEHADESLPKVFISELKTAECSALVQDTARLIARQVKPADVASGRLLYAGRTWAASFATYRELLEESEYAAWLYAYGFRANHFTISVNHLRAFPTLQEVNTFITGAAYALNQSGGEIKGTPAELLEQSSTLAEPARVDFTEGAREIPACYYEFARRYPDASGKLYQGFIAASADKIFESTNARGPRAT